MDSKKILKVSYGTFSCTLEGFDDAVDAMTAIASYFQQLAAADPSFGATPVQPDATAMARIAERIADQPVEAREEPDGIALRATTDTATGKTDKTGPSAASNDAPPETGSGKGGPASPSMRLVSTDGGTSERALERGADAPTGPGEPPDPASLPPELRPRLVQPAAVADADSVEAFFAKGAGTDVAEDALEDIEALPTAQVFSAPTKVMPPAKGPNESIEEKLSRIRAVVAQVEQSEAPPALAEASSPKPSEAPELPPILPETDLDDMLARIEAATAPQETKESTPTEAEQPAPADAEPAHEEQQQSSLPDEAADEKLTVPEESDAASQNAPAATATDAPDDTQPAPPAETKPSDQAMSKGALPEIGPEHAGDVSRLLVETEQHLAEPDGATRRNAFAQLRAAVAARFADTTISQDVQVQADAQKQVFASDLAEAVTPRATGTPPETTKAQAPSGPLRLVASQRVDIETVPEQPVAPRRVAPASGMTATSADLDFKTYAKAQGAETLAEVTEAAAAHLFFVETMPSFSRTQVLARARAALSQDVSREDGLRNFGLLLREGKIEKVRNGQFVATENIRFKPRDRDAG